MAKLELAGSYLQRAWNKLEEARNFLKKFNYAESVSAAQECIEFSMKSVFLIFEENFSKSHELKAEEFIKILKKIPKELEFYNFPRLYLFSKFWSNFYIAAKYGFENFEIGADKLFKEDEANLALKHADECYYASNGLYQNKLINR